MEIPFRHSCLQDPLELELLQTQCLLGDPLGLPEKSRNDLDVQNVIGGTRAIALADLSGGRYPIRHTSSSTEQTRTLQVSSFSRWGILMRFLSRTIAHSLRRGHRSGEFLLFYSTFFLARTATMITGFWGYSESWRMCDKQTRLQFYCGSATMTTCNHWNMQEPFFEEAVPGYYVLSSFSYDVEIRGSYLKF